MGSLALETWMKKICFSPALLVLLALAVTFNYLSFGKDIHSSRFTTEKPQTTHVTDLEEENMKLKNKVILLQYQLSMKEARDTSFVVGPMKLSCLPPDVLAMYGEYNTPPWNPEHFVKNGISVNQIPEIGQKHMTYLGSKEGWSKTWTTLLVDDLVRAVKNKEDISPGAYPKSMEQVQTALDRILPMLSSSGFEKKTKPINILVAGSVAPWVEAIVLSHSSIQLYNDRIITTDYNDIEIKDSKHRIEFVRMGQLQKKPPQPLFDVVISYSSIEHDGLGRYGDPINPRGDFAAMHEYSLMMKDGGLFLLGIPISKHGSVVYNTHRLYSEERFSQLTKGYEQIGDRIVVPEQVLNWQYQPITILQKLSTKENVELL